MTHPDAGWNHAVQLVTSLADCHEEMIRLARLLRNHPDVSSVQVSLFPRRYLSGLNVGGFVDAALQSGDSVVWTLDIDITASGWEIAAEIGQHTDLGWDSLGELSVASGVDLDTLTTRLTEASGAMSRDVQDRIESSRLAPGHNSSATATDHDP